MLYLRSIQLSSLFQFLCNGQALSAQPRQLKFLAAVIACDQKLRADRASVISEHILNGVKKCALAIAAAPERNHEPLFIDLTNRGHARNLLEECHQRFIITCNLVQKRVPDIRPIV